MARIIETADLVPGRLRSVGLSLASWYRKENFRLAREREMFREHLGGSEFERAMCENAAEQKTLDGGWENSSVRRHLADAETAAGRIETPGGSEQRSIVLASSPPATHRAVSTGTSRLTAKTLAGYAAKFNVWADLRYFKERIAAGAFAKALPKSDVRLLYNHDANHLFGRSSAATLEMAEDTVGLRFVGYLLPFDAASYALARRVDRKDISGCSFSFIVAKDAWTFARRPGDLDERTIIEIDKLFDVGPVTFPAYPQTTVTATFEQMPSRTGAPAHDLSAEYIQECENAEYEEFCQGYDLQRGPISTERQRDIDRKYRKMGRILARNHPKGLSGGS